MPNTYDLACTVCDFQRTIEGVTKSLDCSEAHTAAFGADHFVNICITDYI